MKVKRNVTIFSRRRWSDSRGSGGLELMYDQLLLRMRSLSQILVCADLYGGDKGNSCKLRYQAFVKVTTRLPRETLCEI